MTFVLFVAELILFHDTMLQKLAKLVDSARNTVATATVVNEGDRFRGTIDLRHTPLGLRVLFDEFDSIVNGQMFSFLDEIQDKIAAHPFRAVFEDGTEVSVKDLQVYPSTGDVSFKLAEVGNPRENPPDMG